MRRARFLLRAVTIVAFVLLHGLRWAVGALAMVVLRRPGRDEWFASCVLALFRSLGAAFIKVGQIMSTRPDLLPPHVIAALERLQDDVGPFPFSQVQATLVEDLGRPLAELFDEFSPTPVASASVAQVHRARLRDGRVVAVKVRRPRIVELCDFDLRAARWFARLLELAPSLRLLAPVESVEQFGEGIRAQLDFTIEAANNRRFQANFVGDREIVFPTLVEELCGPRVLVMEFIDGTKILHFRSTQADPKRLAAIGFRALLKMVFEDGFVHADLHPGNIFVTRDGRVALLDLGLVGVLDDHHRRAFARYFAAWAARDGATMARLMTELSPAPGTFDAAAFEAAVEAFLRRYHGQRLGDVEVSRVVLDLMNLLRRHRVRLNPTFTLVNIAIAVTEGIGKQLDPEVDLVRAALPFFARFDFSATVEPSRPAATA